MQHLVKTAAAGVVLILAVAVVANVVYQLLAPLIVPALVAGGLLALMAALFHFRQRHSGR